jgi:hypothetical protein
MCRDVLKTPVFCVGGGKVSAVLARQDTPRPVKVQHENTFDWLKKMTKLVVLNKILPHPPPMRCFCPLYKLLLAFV